MVCKICKLHALSNKRIALIFYKHRSRSRFDSYDALSFSYNVVKLKLRIILFPDRFIIVKHGGKRRNKSANCL